MEDAELVVRMKAHDRDAEDALRELMRSYADSLYGMARRLLNDPRDAEEAVEDTFYKAFDRADTYRGEGRVCAWLKTICHHDCVVRNRRKRLRLVSYDDLATRDERYLKADQCREQEGCEARIELEKALRRLPDVQREAVVLVGGAGLTQDEAAKAVGVAATTLAYRVRAGKRRLAELMTEWDPTEADGA